VLRALLPLERDVRARVREREEKRREEKRREEKRRESSLRCV
jgi:hypothetical protein